MKPKAALALRISGQLLLGLARIYSRKVTFLFADCSDALSKIQSVGPGAPVASRPTWRQGQNAPVCRLPAH